MQPSKHNEQVCTPMQTKLNTIVDNTTIALKSQLNALFADLLVESEEYNETNKILLTLPIVKKLFSAMSYVTTPTQEYTEPVINTTPSNMEQTCTFNYDSLNHITPPKIDEDDDEVKDDIKNDIKNEVKDDVQQDKEEQEEDVEEADESEEDEDEQEVKEDPTDTSVIEPVTESISVTNEEGKENIYLEIIEPDEISEVKEEIEDAQDDEEVEEEEEQDDEEVEEEDEDEEEEQDNEEDEEDEVEEEPKVVVEEPKKELEEQEDDVEEVEEEEEPSSEEELVTEESEEDDTEEQDEVEEEDDDGEEVFEIDIFGKTYYTNNATNGDIYLVDESGDPGDEVGKFVKGIATFTKK